MLQLALWILLDYLFTFSYFEVERPDQWSYLIVNQNNLNLLKRQNGLLIVIRNL